MHLKKLLVSFCIFQLLWSGLNANAQYTFTRIADSIGPLADFHFASPSLSSTGTVAFLGTLDNGNWGVFSGNGGALTTIATTPLQFASFGYPTINDAGTVAFRASNWNGVGGSRIYAGSGGPLITIADTAGPLKEFSGGYSTSINTAGTVAFWALPDSGPPGIFSGNGGAVALAISSLSVGIDSTFTMNDAGSFAFERGDGSRIFTVNGGLVTTIADNSGPFNYFSRAPSINEAGTVAFNAGIGGIDGGVFGIYTGRGGPLTTIADLTGPFSYLGDFYDYLPAINASGTVAFMAGLDAGGGGIFIGNGTTTSQILDTTAPLFGSTLTGFGISPTSLNDAGQVAFYYELANGITGIAVATPVPEPAPSLLLALSLTLSLARRIPRPRRAM